MSQLLDQHNLDKISFKIIAKAGEAKSYFIEAMQSAAKNDFDEAENLIDKGLISQQEAFVLHYELIEAELSQSIKMSMLLLHAEDTLNSTEIIKIMAEDALTQYRKINVIALQLGLSL